VSGQFDPGFPSKG